MSKTSYKNEHFKIATNHLRIAKEEISKCADEVYEKLSLLKGEVANEEALQYALSALQFQDIVTQRLSKVEEFLNHLDEKVLIESDRKYLEQFEWRNEVDQKDIDRLFEATQ
ncbi:MAG: hypothetical protein GXO61_01360 [Epsilonproteobacteria bacterium]|nr:hypothetical protein [Campylobacterota bacterium]